MLSEPSLRVQLGITAKFEQRVCDTDDPKYMGVVGEGLLLFHQCRWQGCSHPFTLQW